MWIVFLANQGSNNKCNDIIAQHSAVRMLKHNYFPAIIVSIDSHPAALFRVTQSLLGGNNTKVQLKSHYEEYAVHLANKIAH